MADYTLSFVAPGQFAEWTDPDSWSGRIVPDSIDADVHLAAQPAGTFFVYVTAGVTSNLTMHSLDMQNASLTVAGSFNVDTTMSISADSGFNLIGGSLSAQNIFNAGGFQQNGTVTAHSFVNTGGVVGGGLTINTDTFDNIGSLSAASGTLTINTDPGGFSALSASVLSGGTYLAGAVGSGNPDPAANALYLNVGGGAIETLATTITLLNSSTIYSFVNSASQFVSLQNSLHEVSADGHLVLQGGSYNFGDLDIAGTVQLGPNNAQSDATLAASHLTVAPGGTISGIGIISSALTNNGTLVASALNTGGNLLINGPVSGAGLLEIAPGNVIFQHGFTGNLSSLEIGAATAQDVHFSNNQGRLILDDVGSYNGTITPSTAGIASAIAGNDIVLKGVAIESIRGTSYIGSSAGGTLTLLQTGGPISLKFTGNFTASSFSLAADNGIAGATRITVDSGAGNPVCFAAGTLIRTTRGEVRVEDLRVGDHVLTSTGIARPIVWLGCRTLGGIGDPIFRDCWPIRIAPDAFAPGAPRRELILSPGHAVCVDVIGEVFIPVGRLVNGGTIRREPVDEIGYWHVELESHDVMLAEGLTVESYINVDNRQWFAGTPMPEDPQALANSMTQYARPLIEEGPIVEAVRAQLVTRAEAIGWRSTRDMDLHLMVDGVRVDGNCEGDRWRFTFLAEARDARIVSATFVPAHDVAGSDPRKLGLCVNGLSLGDGELAPVVVPLDHAGLSGLYSLEREGGLHWRWSDGSVFLPAELWRSFEAEVVVEIAFLTFGGQRWIEPARTDGLGKPSHIRLVA